ncbi:MAG: hypothetical protein H6742_16940 [Alphaproteobacteria bacterium]|nr:hypothetical protein [Alphaproteobacteria bacterium]
MSTNPVYAWGRDHLLARAHTPDGLVLYAAGERIAAWDCHPNHPVSFTDEGLALFADSRGVGQLVDLWAVAAGGPTTPREVGRQATVLHPDGDRVVARIDPRWPRTGADGVAVHGVVCRRIDDDRVVWAADPTAFGDPRRVFPFGEAVDQAVAEWRRSGWRAPTGSIHEESTELVLAEDGETWALVGTERLVIGRKRRVFADIYWHQWSFYPQNATFDLRRERVYISGSPGVVCFGLDGTVQAGWSGSLPCSPFDHYGEQRTQVPVAICCPVTLFAEQVLIVVKRPDGPMVQAIGTPPLLEVHRFDASTLAWRGRMDELPARRLADSRQALLVLDDAGIAWLPPAAPIVVLPGTDATRRSTAAVVVVGDPLPDRVPHLDGDGYDRAVGDGGPIGPLADATNAERVGLARSLLQELVPDPRFSELLDGWPDSFRPFADAVLAWDDATVALLAEMRHDGWSRVVEGASDAAVDDCVARLREGLAVPEVDQWGRPCLSDATSRRLALLMDVLSPLALQAIADLAEEAPGVGQAATEACLELPAEGPAVPRFVPRALQIIGREDGDGSTPPGMRACAPLAGLDRGVECGKPPVPLLDIPVALLPGDPLAGSKVPVQHVFWANCEACDEPIRDEEVWRVAGAGVQLTGRTEAPDCEGDGEEPGEQTWTLTLEPPRKDRDWKDKLLGQLGGRPPWWQSPAPAVCPDCGRLCFFVAFVHASAVREDMHDVGLYAFQCEDCGVGVTVSQMT